MLDAALSLPATALGVRAARNAVDAAIRRLSRDDDLLCDVRLCVSEAVTNVVRHAYRPAPGRVGRRHGCSSSGNEVIVTCGSGDVAEAGRPSDTGGYGLEIIDELTTRHAIRTSRGDRAPRLRWSSSSAVPVGSRTVARLLVPPHALDARTGCARSPCGGTSTACRSSGAASATHGSARAPRGRRRLGPTEEDDAVSREAVVPPPGGRRKSHGATTIRTPSIRTGRGHQSSLSRRSFARTTRASGTRVMTGRLIAERRSATEASA